MKYRSVLLGSAALACGAPALAGEEVLYQPAPEWVVPAELPEARRGPPIVLFDDQRRIGGQRTARQTKNNRHSGNQAFHETPKNQQINSSPTLS